MLGDQSETCRSRMCLSSLFHANVPVQFVPVELRWLFFPMPLWIARDVPSEQHVVKFGYLRNWRSIFASVEHQQRAILRWKPLLGSPRNSKSECPVPADRRYAPSGVHVAERKPISARILDHRLETHQTTLDKPPITSMPNSQAQEPRSLSRFVRSGVRHRHYPQL